MLYYLKNNKQNNSGEIMAYDKERRQKFADHLRTLATKYKIRQVEIARTVNKQRQHISSIFKGTIIFNAKEFNILTNMFRQKGISNSDLALLNRLFVETKSSLELKKLDLATPVDPIKQIIIENLDDLTPMDLIIIHRQIEKFKFNNLKSADEKTTES